nr:hypothetical protein Itr_chr02CG17100 [Ipomoea trifida]
MLLTTTLHKSQQWVQKFSLYAPSTTHNINCIMLMEQEFPRNVIKLPRTTLFEEKSKAKKITTL